jgi:hypothetical protein
MQKELKYLLTNAKELINSVTSRNVLHFGLVRLTAWRRRGTAKNGDEGD